MPTDGLTAFDRQMKHRYEVIDSSLVGSDHRPEIIIVADNSYFDEKTRELQRSALEALVNNQNFKKLGLGSCPNGIAPDDNKRMQGAESEFYVNLNPAAPYVAKNGLMDDISELLLIRGMTPEITVIELVP